MKLCAFVLTLKGFLGHWSFETRTPSKIAGHETGRSQWTMTPTKTITRCEWKWNCLESSNWKRGSSWWNKPCSFKWGLITEAAWLRGFESPFWSNIIRRVGVCRMFIVCFSRCQSHRQCRDREPLPPGQSDIWVWVERMEDQKVFGPCMKDAVLICFNIVLTCFSSSPPNEAATADRDLLKVGFWGFKMVQGVSSLERLKHDTCSMFWAQGYGRKL